jgi:hypothetical protein
LFGAIAQQEFLNLARRGFWQGIEDHGSRRLEMGEMVRQTPMMSLAVEMFSPPEMMMSFELNCSVRNLVQRTEEIMLGCSDTIGLQDGA